MKYLVAILVVVALLCTGLVMAADMKGKGAVTWNNTTPFVVAYAYTTGTNTLAVTTDEAFTIVSAYGGTEACFTATLAATGGTAITGTVTWSSGDVLTLETGGQDKTTDCTGVTLTACITAANALTFTYGDFTVTAGSTFVDSTYTDYYEPENAADLSATAVSTGGAASAAVATIAQGSATFYDSAGSLDCTNQTLLGCEALLEAAYGGVPFSVTIRDGLNADLANGFNDVANLGATDMEGTGAAIPFTAGSAILDYLEEDRFRTISHINYSVNIGTAGFIYIIDQGTTVWAETLVDGATTYTQHAFNPPIFASGGAPLLVQLVTSDSMSAGTLYVIGTDK